MALAVILLTFLGIFYTVTTAVEEEGEQDMILKIILDKLDLSEVPDVSSAHALVPEYMKHVYELTGQYRGDKTEEVSIAALKNLRTSGKFWV